MLKSRKQKRTLHVKICTRLAWKLPAKVAKYVGKKGVWNKFLMANITHLLYQNSALPPSFTVFILELKAQ